MVVSWVASWRQANVEVSSGNYEREPCETFTNNEPLLTMMVVSEKPGGETIVLMVGDSKWISDRYCWFTMLNNSLRVMPNTPITRIHSGHSRSQQCLYVSFITTTTTNFTS